MKHRTPLSLYTLWLLWDTPAVLLLCLALPQPPVEAPAGLWDTQAHTEQPGSSCTKVHADAQLLLSFMMHFCASSWKLIWLLLLPCLIYCSLSLPNPYSITAAHRTPPTERDFLNIFQQMPTHLFANCLSFCEYAIYFAFIDLIELRCTFSSFSFIFRCPHDLHLLVVVMKMLLLHLDD